MCLIALNCQGNFEGYLVTVRDAQSEIIRILVVYIGHRLSRCYLHLRWLNLCRAGWMGSGRRIHERGVLCWWNSSAVESYLESGLRPASLPLKRVEAPYCLWREHNERPCQLHEIATRFQGGRPHQTGWKCTPGRRRGRAIRPRVQRLELQRQNPKTSPLCLSVCFKIWETLAVADRFQEITRSCDNLILENGWAGNWQHAGFHLTTSIATPAMLTLPFALRELGWVAGILALTLCAGVSFYAYTIISQVLEYSERRGHRFLRFRDLGAYILGTYVPPVLKERPSPSHVRF